MQAFSVKRLATSTLSALLPVAFAVVPALMNPAAAQDLSSVSVYPTRIVLEGRERSGTVSLANRGSSAVTYRIGFVDMVADQHGHLETVDTLPPGHRSAKDMLSYAPRQIRLAPGESQTVRIMARKPAELAPGEYRSHIVLQALPETADGQDIAELVRNLPPDTLVVRPETVYGVALPVIVRHGELHATARIDQTRLVRDNGGQALEVTIARAGERSLYGEIVVEQLSAGGQPKRIGVVQGVGVYVPNDYRTQRVKLEPGPALAGARLRVAYQDRGQVLAETTITAR